MPVIIHVRCNRVKEYSSKYTIKYIVNTRNKDGNTQHYYTKVFILVLVFILNSFLTTKNLSASTSIKIYNFTQA
jgi:hypothetical protein